MKPGDRYFDAPSNELISVPKLQFSDSGPVAVFDLLPSDPPAVVREPEVESERAAEPSVTLAVDENDEMYWTDSETECDTDADEGGDEKTRGMNSPVYSPTTPPREPYSPLPAAPPSSPSYVPTNYAGMNPYLASSEPSMPLLPLPPVTMATIVNVSPSKIQHCGHCGLTGHYQKKCPSARCLDCGDLGHSNSKSARCEKHVVKKHTITNELLRRIIKTVKAEDETASELSGEDATDPIVSME